MFGKRQPPEEGRRRPAQGRSTRAGNFSYYTQSRSVRGPADQPIARRQPLPKNKAEIARYLGQRFGSILAVFALLALIVSSLQVSMAPRINILNDSTVYRIHADSVYENSVSQALRSSWANTNKITINTEKIGENLRRDYPEIAAVSVTLPVLGQRPIIYIQLTRPSLVLISSAGGAYVLDETGRVLAPAAQVDNLDAFRLPTVNDESGLRPEVGQLVLPQATVRFVTNVIYQFQRAHVGYSKLTLPEASQELDVRLLGKRYIVKFNTHADSAREQVGSYLAVQANLDKKNIEPKQYIDARLPGRVYYK